MTKKKTRFSSAQLFTTELECKGGQQWALEARWSSLRSIGTSPLWILSSNKNGRKTIFNQSKKTFPVDKSDKSAQNAHHVHTLHPAQIHCDPPLVVFPQRGYRIKPILNKKKTDIGFPVSIQGQGISGIGHDIVSEGASAHGDFTVSWVALSTSRA